jgi:hypothetical protein
MSAISAFKIFYGTFAAAEGATGRIREAPRPETYGSRLTLMRTGTIVSPQCMRSTVESRATIGK